MSDRETIVAHQRSPSIYRCVKGNACHIHAADRQDGLVVSDSPIRGAGRLLALDGEWSNVGDVFRNLWDVLIFIDKHADKPPAQQLALAQPGNGDTDGWRTIDSAPKDGTPFLVLTAHGDRYVARCGSSDHFVSLPGFWAIKKPRLWQPLPPLPTPPTQEPGK